jgi:hypothetical protein
MRIQALSEVVAAADRDPAVSISAGMLLIVLVTVVVLVAGIVVVGRARRASRASDEGLASRGGTQRMLAENWALVEKTARETGMSEEEIARVRANVLGLGGG